MTQDIRIDRLSLRVPGLDKDAAEDLARLIALRLTADPPISDNAISHYPISDNRTSDNRTSEDHAAEPQRRPDVAAPTPTATTTSARRSRSSSNIGPTLRLEVGAQADLDGLAWRIAGEIRQALEQEQRQAGGTP